MYLLKQPPTRIALMGMIMSYKAGESGAPQAGPITSTFLSLSLFLCCRCSVLPLFFFNFKGKAKATGNRIKNKIQDSSSRSIKRIKICSKFTQSDQERDRWGVPIVGARPSTCEEMKLTRRLLLPTPESPMSRILKE